MSLKAAVFAVQSVVTKVGKDGYNPHTKKKYATLEGVLEVLNEPLQENSLIVTQTTTYRGEQWVLSTTICTKDAKECEIFDTPLLGLGAGSNPMQALGSAITYARRYALVNYFKLVQSDDDAVGTVEDLKSAPLKSKKPLPFIIAEGKLKGQDAAKMDPKELNNYISTMNAAVEETQGKKPQWFIDLESYVAKREIA